VSAFAWPAAFVVVMIAALLIFRVPLVRLIDRIRNVNIGKYGGIQAESIPPSQQSKAKEDAAAAGPVLDLEAVEDELRSMDNAVVRRNEPLVRQAMESLKPEQRERALLRYAVGTTVQLRFERNYLIIWGSQIAALQLLNTTVSATVEQVRAFYEKASSEFSVAYAAYAFEHWFNYLQSSVLVTSSGSAVSITVDGREFLKYLIDRGYSLSKPY